MKQRAFSQGRSYYRSYPNSFLSKGWQEWTDNPTAVKTAPRPSIYLCGHQSQLIPKRVFLFNILAKLTCGNLNGHLKVNVSCTRLALKFFFNFAE